MKARKTAAQKRREAYEQFEILLREHAEKLNATAEGLRDGSVNRFHAANRLRKMAKELGA